MALGKGRPPKSAKTRRDEGAPGHRPILEDLVAPTGEPPMPDDFTAEAQSEWHRICGEIATIKMLAETDRSALAEYVRLWDTLRQCRAKLAVTGYTYESTGDRNGLTVKKYPEVDIVLSTSRAMIPYLREFGLTPASRTRIKIDPQQNEDEAFTKFLNREE